MYIRLAFVFSILGFLAGCDKQIHPDFGPLDDKLSIVADFNVIDGLIVSIERAVPLTTESFLYKNLVVNDAKLYLIDSTTNTSWLILFNDMLTKYYHPTLVPIEHHTYRIEIEWKGKKWTSVPTSTPRLPDIHLKNKIISRTSKFGFNGFELGYTISLDSSPPNLYYSAGTFLKSMHFDGRPMEFIEYIQKADLCGYKFNILPKVCLNGNTSDIELEGSILNNTGTDSISRDRLFKGKHFIYFTTISPRYYSYVLAIAEPEPFERFFLNPTITPTDFPGAFGTFLIRNMVIIDSLQIQ